MEQQVLIQSRDKAMVIGPHILTEASVNFPESAWIYLNNTQVGHLNKTKRRTHYIEVYRSRETGICNESTWLRGLEKSHYKEFHFLNKSTETLDLNLLVRQWIDSLPYEDRLEAIAVEVLFQQSRAIGRFYSRTPIYRYHGSASLYRHQT